MEKSGEKEVGGERAGQQGASKASYCNGKPWCFRRDHGACWWAECSSHLGGSQNIHHDSQTLGLGTGHPVRAKDATGNLLTKTSDSGLGRTVGECGPDIMHVRSAIWKPKFVCEGGSSTSSSKIPYLQNDQDQCHFTEKHCSDKLKIAINLEAFIGKVGTISLYLNPDRI